MIKLQRRVLAVTLGLTVGTVILTGAAVFLMSSASLRNNLDNSILQLARTEIASATDTGSLHVHETGQKTLDVSGVAGYEKFVWLEDIGGRHLASTANVLPNSRVIGAEPFRRVARAGETTFGDIEIEGRSIRAVFYPFRDMKGQPAIGIVGFPTSIVTDLIAKIGEVVLIAGAFCILAAGAIAVFLARSVADPMRELARQVEQIDPSRADSPPLVEAPYEEMSTLVGSFNHLVGRVQEMLHEREKTINRQRQFVADTSHELRTPVSNLQGTIEVTLRRERTEAEYRGALQTSLGEVQRMSRLIQDLLALAKSDVGEFDVHPKECDLSVIVRSAAASDASREIETQMDVPDIFLVRCDADRVRQALDNLLRNALTHAKSRIQIRVFEDEGDAVISVSNDGPPIAAGDTELIFERFYRLDHSRARDTGGSGLGLPIARAIAIAHGGTVTVESGPTETTFWLRLPKNL